MPVVAVVAVVAVVNYTGAGCLLHTPAMERRKLQALEKTFAFPASPWFVFGGPQVVVALVMALFAALVQLSQH